MYSRMRMIKSTGTYSDNVTRLKQAPAGTDAVVIGAGAGLSASAGFVCSGESHAGFIEIHPVQRRKSL